MKKILLNKSKISNNENNFDIVNLEQKVKVMPFDSVNGVIDQYSLYEKEKNNSDKFRLIFTINPICSNILFNSITEVVKNEGSDNVTILRNSKTLPPPSTAINKGVLSQYSAIRNTEYSNEVNEFVYHCGYDIFNNHILRGKNFKSVNNLNDSTNSHNIVFNTIDDYARYDDGNAIKILSMVNPDPNNKIDSHLYQYDDINNYYDSINENLAEEDGWLGFINKAKVRTSSSPTTPTSINKVMNKNKTCEFIDMYPDRSLYSFIPKLNKIRRRLEYNWNYCLTYPYKNVTNDLIEFSYLKLKDVIETTGIKVFYNEVNEGINGVVFKSIIKHNLLRGDKIKLFYKQEKDTNYNEINNQINITNNGDFQTKDKDYSFRINLTDLEEYDLIDNNGELKYDFVFKKVVNGFECDYYYRMFKKLPNFKFSKENVTIENVNNEDFLKENTIPFINETNRLGFSDNIYGDKQVQIVFTDDVNINCFTDNLGRPLTELFLTIVKNNKGYKKWYTSTDTNISDPKGEIEFSHAFGEITSGIDLPMDIYDNNNRGCYNVKYLHNITGESSTPLEKDINIEQNEFWGDLVEFSGVEIKETILEKVCHRFNTAQRESVNDEFAKIYYDEINFDDYDIREDNSDFLFTKRLSIPDEKSSNRININPEGYYYEPHYSVKLRAFSTDINQEIKSLIAQKSNIINQGNGWVITPDSDYYVQAGDYVVIVLNYMDSDIKTERCRVIDILENKQIVIERPINISINEHKPNEGSKILVRKENYDIPSYAYNLKDGSGRFVWRDIYSSGDYKVKDLPEYIFTNGAFYIHNNINFFLKRQDPFLLNPNFKTNRVLGFGELRGNKNDISEFEYYKEEDNFTC